MEAPSPKLSQAQRVLFYPFLQGPGPWNDWFLSNGSTTPIVCADPSRSIGSIYEGSTLVQLKCGVGTTKRIHSHVGMIAAIKATCVGKCRTSVSPVCPVRALQLYIRDILFSIIFNFCVICRHCLGLLFCAHIINHQTDNSYGMTLLYCFIYSHINQRNVRTAIKTSKNIHFHKMHLFRFHLFRWPVKILFSWNTAKQIG